MPGMATSAWNVVKQQWRPVAGDHAVQLVRREATHAWWLPDGSVATLGGWRHLRLCPGIVSKPGQRQPVRQRIPVRPVAGWLGAVPHPADRHAWRAIKRAG